MKIIFYFCFKNGTVVDIQYDDSEENANKIIERFKDNIGFWSTWFSKRYAEFLNFYFDPKELFACSYKILEE